MSSKTPLELAQSARDKIQASAAEIWSSIRSIDEAKLQRNADSNPVGETSDAHPTTTAEAAALSLETIENVFKVMFGSCTAGMPQRSASSTDEAANSKPIALERRCRSSRSRDFVSSRNIGEHVYEQLFMDEQARATRAVEGLRAKSSSTSTSRSHQFSAYFGTPMASTPIGHQVPVSAVTPTTKDIDVSEGFDFDDGISAISNHTLEELARLHDQRQSLPPTKNSKSTNGGRADVVETISYPSRHRLPTPPSPPSKSVPTIMTPVKFSRGPSHCSKGTKSTSSTQDSHSEFASVWRKEEAKYWDNVVESERKKGSRSSLKLKRQSRCGSHSTKQDFTVTTADSSYNSSSPHHLDVIPFDADFSTQEIFQNDFHLSSLHSSSRIQNIHLHSGLAEI